MHESDRMNPESADLNQNLENKAVLRKAVAGVAVPPGLGAAVRSSLQQGQPVGRIRDAVNAVPVPPFLGARIRNRIASDERPQRAPRRWLQRLVSVTSATALIMTAGIAWHLGHLRFTAGAQTSYIHSVSSQVATLMRVGLGDHIHCSVFRKYPKNAPTVESFLKTMNPQYAGLIPIVRQQFPTSWRMMLAHECRFEKRKFIHLSLMNGNNLVSLVIARKADGESFQTEEMIPALVQSGIPMYQSGVQRFQISAFETRDHLVYFVSDLPKGRNTDIMIALAPRVKAFLAASEL
jgi:hypothetical protein